MGWPVCQLVLLVLAGTNPALAQQALAPAQAVHASAAACPVQAPTHGHLTDVYFATGDRVKRGQLLAKVERPDGTPTYLVAPVAGRIGPTRLKLGEHLPAHATLAMIETAAR